MTRSEGSKSSLSQVDVAFLRAARSGNIEKVLNFLNENGDINTANANGLNALHLASKEGHVDVMRELLRRGAPVNGTTKKGNTALHIASLAGKKEAVDLMLESGAAVNSKAQNGFTPLYMASQEGHVDVVKVLLSNGANQQSCTEDGFTAIDVAVQQGHDKVVAALLHSDSRKGYRSLHTAARKDFAKAAKLLLQKGHQPDVEAPNGFTPLHLACKYNNFNVGSILIQFGATVDYKTKNYIITPLHVASKYGHLRMVTLLSDKGSKIDLPNKDGLTPLHCAARDGQDAVVEYLLQKNASIIARTKHGLTPLHMACQGNNLKTAGVLLDSKAPVNAVAANGLTPLHISAHYGHVEIAELLLEKGADTDARARNGFTALHIACKKNREPVIQLLLKYGANVHSANEGGQTPMHVATYYGNVTLVLLLLQHGGSPDITNVRGETALHIACRRKEITIVRLLLRNGAAVDAKTQDRETPLHIATRTHNTELVHLLLDHGASPDCIDKNKCTPLHIAAREGDEEIVGALVEHNASVTALSKKGFTPLHEAARSGHVKIIILLLKYYENPDPEGKHGLTPLHVAAHYDHANVALYLLENGASAYAATKNGFTPLHIAAQRNQIDIGTAMLNYGVEPDIRTQTGISPLHLAAKEGNIEMCEMLLEHGAMPGITTTNGLTPLHLCARWNRVEVAKLLLKHKTPIDAQTVSGFTPLHIACVYGHEEIAKLLLEEGGSVEAKTKDGYMPLHLAAQYGHKILIEILLINHAPPDALTNDGYSALFIAQTVMKSKTIIEILLKVTKNTEPPTVIKTGEQPEIEGVATIFSPAPEELPEEEVVLEALVVQDEEAEAEAKQQEESYDRFMTMEMDLGGAEEDPRTPTGTLRDSTGGFNSLGRDSTMFASFRYSGMFQESKSASDLDFARSNTRSSSTDIIEATTETNIVEAELPSSLADMNIDNIAAYDPPVTGGFLVSFLVDARGVKMESSQTGIKMCLPPRSCQMPTRIMCRLLRLKPRNLPPMDDGEGLACRVLDIGPSGLKFLQPIEVDLPHFASMRDGERELVVMRTDDGGLNWREVSTEDGQGVEGYTKNDEVFLPVKRFTKIVTKDFPERFAVVSRLKKESFSIGPAGDSIKSSVLSQVKLSVPEGAVSNDIQLTMQVQPVDENFNNLEEWLAVSPLVTLQPSDVQFSKPIQITLPTPIYSGSSSSDLQTSLRLLSSVPKEAKGSGTRSSDWEDITDSTPLTVMNECASFTTRQAARYWLVETRNQDNVTSDARLLYRKLTAVPYQARFVVYAKMSADGTEARLRICCLTDDRAHKTLENQTGYVEVARSCDIEVSEGRPIHVRCLGNLAPVNREPIQFNFYSFRENRLSMNVRIVDGDQPPSCRLAFLKEPKKDRQGNIHAICSLNVDLSEKNLKRDQIKRLPDELLDLIGKEVGDDGINLGKQLDLTDEELQEIHERRADEPFEIAGDVLKSWRDKKGDEATMAALEQALHDIGREDIANDFKRLAYTSYSKDTVTLYHSTVSSGEESPGPRPTRISELLDQTNDLNVTSDDDSGKSPNKEVHMFEAGVPVEAQEDPSERQLNGNSQEEEKDKLIQEMFANDKGVLDFFGGEGTPQTTDETEI